MRRPAATAGAVVYKQPRVVFQHRIPEGIEACNVPQLDYAGATRSVCGGPVRRRIRVEVEAKDVQRVVSDGRGEVGAHVGPRSGVSEVEEVTA